MFNFIRTYQLDIMLVLRAMSFMMAIMLFITRFLPKRRKWILIGMELVATLLLSFDRLAYIYAGNPTSLGYVMVRLSNFMVFFLTPGTVFLFTIYLEDLFEKNAVVLKTKTLTIVGIICIISMFFRIVNIFTGFYYFFDEANRYQRGPGFLIVYLVPVICPLIQFGVIQKYRHSLSRYIYLALVLYIFVPITMGIIQIFSYGISIVNMSMVLVSISLYFFTYFDINDEVERAHVLEMRTLKEEQRQMKNLFSHTANAFVKAIEKRDESLKGESEKAALIARKLAEKYGLSEEKCDEVYYAALLHNAGFSSLPDSFFAAEEINWNSNLINGELPKLSSEILSEIKEFPYLSIAVRYMNERFDGKDNKLGLKGKEIPEISRILSITEEYCKMTYSNKFSNSVPVEVVREELLKESGFKFDPDLSDAMIKLIDEGISENSSKHNFSIESNLTSDSYREHVSKGIPVLQTETEITLRSVPLYSDGIISAPSLIVFDSLDQKVHSSQTSIEAFRYTENFGLTVTQSVQTQEIFRLKSPIVKSRVYLKWILYIKLQPAGTMIIF